MAKHLDKPMSSLAGRWHLVAAECPENEIPQHRVDFVFHDEPAGLRGAILSRRDGSEIPLQAENCLQESRIIKFHDRFD